MSSSRESLLEIWQPTDTFLRLVKEAATDCREETVSAKETPVTKLKSTSNCEDVQKELVRSYQKMIEKDSSTAAIFDPQKFELPWVPTTFVLTRGPFKIPDRTSAIAIPLVKDGNPKIEYYDAHGVSSMIDWNIGSVIYMAGNSSLRSDGRGNASCIFFVFRMKT